MSDQRPSWRRALKEPNAIGWIGFFLLVIAIGFGVLYFNGEPAGPAGNVSSQPVK